jgi:hypothetical protein
VAELVDALDLGSSGAIRGGSSPPFGIARSVRLDWRSYETEERDPRLLEKEKGQRSTAVSRSSGGHQDRAATSCPTGENGKASRDIDEVGTTRIVTTKKKPVPRDRLFSQLESVLRRNGADSHSADRFDVPAIDHVEIQHQSRGSDRQLSVIDQFIAVEMDDQIGNAVVVDIVD